MLICRRFLVLVLVLFCGACASAPKRHTTSELAVASGASREASPAVNVIAFVHAAVIPMDEERVLRDQTVVVADRKIVAIGPAAEVEVPAGALEIDASGRYLLPALCDMHVHLLNDAWNMMLRPEAQLVGDAVPYDAFLFPYVANGVTLVQAMSGTAQEIALRDRIERGELLGPRMILGRMIDGPQKAWPPPLSVWVASAAEAGEAVRSSQHEGYDKIKVYSFLSRESYDAIVATAGELHMDVIGHIPMAVSVEYVLDAGQKLIAHSEEVLKHAGGDHSADHIEYFANLMSERGVWMSPTLVTTRSIVEIFDDPAGLLDRPEAAYFGHPMEQGVWSFLMENIYGPIPTEVRHKIRVGFEEFQKPLTTAFHEHGGKLLAGTDTLWPGLVPGFALQRELQELVAVGLTPFEALRTATINPFEYLGEADRAGTIEIGKQSDLLLVDANPLEDVAAASRIAGVLIRGRWMAAEEIQRRMQELAASFAAAGSSPANASPASR
jgi:imidazolonepropionase-like amidohydrolase